MQLRITRSRQVDTDRRGNVRNVRFSVEFKLVTSEDEHNVVLANGLGGEALFQSQARFVPAREVIDGTATWTQLPLTSALSIQGSMVENCRTFAALVATADGFEGTSTVELVPA